MERETGKSKYIFSHKEIFWDFPSGNEAQSHLIVRHLHFFVHLTASHVCSVMLFLSLKSVDQIVNCKFAISTAHDRYFRQSGSMDLEGDNGSCLAVEYEISTESR